MARTPSHNRLAVIHGLPLPPVSPALAALPVQAVAALIAIAVDVAVSAIVHGQALGHFHWALFQGIVAAAIAHRLGMAAWWLPIHLAFTPALVMTLSLNIYPFWFLGAFLLLALIYGKTYQTQVPLYLSSRAAVDALASLLPERRGFSFLDLGSGCGGLLRCLSRQRPDGNYHGIEAAPLPFLMSRCRALFGATDCGLTWGNFWNRDLAPYDVVYAYLSPVPMMELWRKARREMRRDSIFVSNSFLVPGFAPEMSIKVDDFEGSMLHVWRM